MPAAWDVFLSYRHADAEGARRLRDALAAHDLRVWFDETDIPDFAGITEQAREGIAGAKALLAYYSAGYPESRACQWELTQAFVAAQRHGDPRERVLVVNPEPTPDHIAPVELRDAKHLSTRDGAAVARHVRALAEPLGAAGPGPSRWLPSQAVGAPRFVGRLREMWSIHSALHGSDAEMITGSPGPGVAFVTGLGGIGKSLVAGEYALRFGPAHPGGVFWLRAAAVDTRPDDIDRQLRAFGAALGIPVGGADATEVRGALAHAIERRGAPCLWIVDDVPSSVDADVVRGLLAPHPLARTLLTTRSRGYAGLARQVDLGALPADDAYALLTAQRRPEDPEEEQAARALAEDLGRHPQALDVTGAGLKADAGLRSFSGYRRMLASPAEDELELVAELADALPTGHERSVAATLARSIDRLDEPGRDLLRLASLFTARPIPRRFVADVFADADNLGGEPALRRTARAAHAAETHSLADTADRNGALHVHALVSRTIHFREPGSARREQLRGAAVATLMRHLHTSETSGPPAFSTAEALARELTADPRSPTEANLLREVAGLDRWRGDFARAHAMLTVALGALKQTAGADDPDTVSTLLDLCDLEIDRGTRFYGHRYLEEALASRRRTLGDEHPDTLDLWVTHALFVGARGNLPAMRDLLRRVLSEARRVLGDEHRVTLTAQDRLALVLAEERDLDGAIVMHEQILAARRATLGDAHPDTRQSLRNLAETLLAAGDGAGACALYEEAVDTCRRAFGDDDPATVTARSDLASALARAGRLEEAVTLLEDVLAAYRVRLGEEHQFTLALYGNLADTLDANGDRARARALWDHEFAGYRRILGDELPTVGAADQVAAAERMYAGGAIREARKTFKSLLVSMPRKLPAEQPDYLA
ncbi:MAG TPA: tetratricopeptide repeat protein [Solirubrobacteraceae bacterium]